MKAIKKDFRFISAVAILVLATSLFYTTEGKRGQVYVAQKNLLKEYINNISNTNSLKDTLKQIVKGLKEDLKTHSKNLKDKVVKIKLKEAIKSINKLCGLNVKSDTVKDSHVVQTMRYLELLKELKKI